jgi:phage terminase large subunit GpA-like protein
LLFEAIDSDRWNRIAVTGPTQTGKTLCSLVIPAAYYLFEVREPCIIVWVPHLEMMKDKWRDDLLPVIERTRYRDLLPRTGSGSRGGIGQSIHFRNGCELRFMTGGGGDKTVAGKTARVVLATEVDGADEAGASSREADRITQIEVRTRAYGDRKLILLECTVSTPQGRIWSEYQAGTKSRIPLPCPHCGQWVSLEREHLAGWQDAETVVAARAGAFFFCPECGGRWTEQQRREANLAAKLLHEGQQIDSSGRITGEPRETDTLGFRWSAVNNLLLTAGDIGQDEWNGAREADEENAEKKLRQFVWCLPYEPPLLDGAPLDPKVVAQRKAKLTQEFLPANTEHLACGIDTGKYQSWFLLMAFGADGIIHVPDYGILEVHADDLAEPAAILQCLREFRERIDLGWPIDGTSERRVPDQVWIDAGYANHAPAIFAFVRESNERGALRYLPTLGRGTSQMRRMRYSAPKRTGREVRKIGDGWHVVRVPKERTYQAFFDADLYKLRLQDACRVPVGQPGSISLFHSGESARHNKLSRHWTSERLIREPVPGKGIVERWDKHGANHLLDCGAGALAAGNLLGHRLVPTDAAGSAAGERPRTDWFAQQKRRDAR